MIKINVFLLCMGIVFWSCEKEELEPYKPTLLYPPVYNSDKILIKWSSVTNSLFTKYELYFSNDDTFTENLLVFSSDISTDTVFTDTNTSLQMNEKKFYKLKAFVGVDMYESNIISSHNWHLFDNLLMTNQNDYQIQNINTEEHPYYRNVPFTITQLEELISVDSLGIPYWLVNGVRYDHPVRHAQMALHLLNSHTFEDDDDIFMNRAKLILERLIEISFEEDNSLFFPYPYDFNLHSSDLNDSEPMIAPWFSGMAQGQILSAFCKYFMISGDSTYLTITEKIFNSYLRVMQKNDLWFAGIDGDNYLWLEEYPDKRQPNKTLNGMIFSIYGLYDYYQMTFDLRSLYLLKSAITTIQKYILKFRVEGEQSLYCLTHQMQYTRYHLTHTAQLGYLFLITGDQFFFDMQQLFLFDYSENL